MEKLNHFRKRNNLLSIFWMGRLLCLKTIFKLYFLLYMCYQTIRMYYLPSYWNWSWYCSDDFSLHSQTLIYSQKSVKLSTVCNERVLLDCRFGPIWKDALYFNLFRKVAFYKMVVIKDQLYKWKVFHLFPVSKYSSRKGVGLRKGMAGHGG